MSSHVNYLEKNFGKNVDCKCENRIIHLIDFGALQLRTLNSKYTMKCIFSCRQCQYNRMMRDTNYSFEL